MSTTTVKSSSKNTQSKRQVSNEKRRYMIEAEAYSIAHARGFQGDNALDDWLAAEREIDSQLARH